MIGIVTWEQLIFLAGIIVAVFIGGMSIARWLSRQISDTRKLLYDKIEKVDNRLRNLEIEVSRGKAS